MERHYPTSVIFLLLLGMLDAGAAIVFFVAGQPGLGVLMATCGVTLFAGPLMAHRLPVLQMVVQWCVTVNLAFPLFVAAICLWYRVLDLALGALGVFLCLTLVRWAASRNMQA